jgi:hypothetical protein
VTRLGGKVVTDQTFQQSEVTIGRAGTCDIVLENLGASRRHAMIHRNEDGYVLSDLDSHNGTYVRGERVSSVLLTDDCEFQIGKTVFQFEQMEPVEAIAFESSLARIGGAISGPEFTPEMTFELDTNHIRKMRAESERKAAIQIVQIKPVDSDLILSLEEPYYLMGAHEACTLRVSGWLTPATVATIVRTEQGYHAIGVVRGFRVNGEPSRDRLLLDGDELSYGASVFRFNAH